MIKAIAAAAGLLSWSIAASTAYAQSPGETVMNDIIRRRLAMASEAICERARDPQRAAADCHAALRDDGESQEDATSRCATGLLASYKKMCPNGPGKLTQEVERHRQASTVSFPSLILDKSDFAQSDRYVIVHGTYIRAPDSMDYLIAPASIDPLAYGHPLDADVSVPLLLEKASRDTRSLLMKCRQAYPAETFSGCDVILEGFLENCAITYNFSGASHADVCLQVSVVTVNPRSITLQ